MHTVSVALAVAAALMLVGMIYEQVGAARDAKRHPPPGRLVEVESHRLHLLAAGEGNPTVVLESGLMGSVLTWDQTQAEIAKLTRVVAYDRAGLGWSDPGPAPRTAERIVDELHRLLDRAGIPPPYVLVGHSFGGLTMILYAARYAEEVAGLVLIDPVVPGEWNPPAKHELKRIQIGAAVCRRAALFSSAGLIRFIALLIRNGAKPLANRLIALISKDAPADTRTTESPWFWNLPESERAMAPVFWVRAKFCNTIASQLEKLPESAAQVAAVRHLDTKPVVVISAGNAPAKRLAEQIAAAQLSSCGRHMVAAQSGHWVMVNQPELVIGTISEVVELARRSPR